MNTKQVLSIGLLSAMVFLLPLATMANASNASGNPGTLGFKGTRTLTFTPTCEFNPAFPLGPFILCTPPHTGLNVTGTDVCEGIVLVATTGAAYILGSQITVIPGAAILALAVAWTSGITVYIIQSTGACAISK